MKSTLITNIKSLEGILTLPHSFKKGEAMSIVDTISNAWLLIEGDRIAGFGPMSSCPERADHTIDAVGRMVLPAWVDSHTHLVYAESRDHEFLARLQGKSYEQIANEGGGILNSALKLGALTEDELLQSAQKRLDEVIATGTGAIEIKSGYGLSLESELKILRVAKRLKESNKIPIKTTFLGAHAIPTIYKHDRRAYIRIVTEQMIPAVAKEGLADYCDVFCDKGFFTVEETAEILEVGYKYGLKPKIHANELANSGGVQVGIAHNAISVDHLEQIEMAEIEALKASNTIPTVLPSVSYFLGIPYAPARKMIDNGLGIVIASDYNPGSSPSGNIPFLMSLACNRMRLLPNEAFNAVTTNASYALEMEDELGSITKGKLANLIITDKITGLSHIPYAFGSNPVYKTFIRGREHTKS